MTLSLYELWRIIQAKPGYHFPTPEPTPLPRPQSPSFWPHSASCQVCFFFIFLPQLFSILFFLMFIHFLLCCRHCGGKLENVNIKYKPKSNPKYTQCFRASIRWMGEPIIDIDSKSCTNYCFIFWFLSVYGYLIKTVRQFFEEKAIKNQRNTGALKFFLRISAWDCKVG